MTVETVASEAAGDPYILIVDDDPALRAMLTEGIRHVGYRIGEAESAEQALALIATQQPKPDLVLIDVHLPGMSGIELAGRLRVDTEVPFLFISCDSNMALAKLAAEYGALAYLVKPLKFEQIAPGIESALSRAEELRQLHLRETQLDAALNQGRETSIAVGVLMERLRIGRKAAFERLRGTARSQRRSIGEVARELIEAAETANDCRAGWDGGSQTTPD